MSNSSKKILIGLAGCKRCGKDTIADWLVRDHGFVKYAFAAPLKETCRVLFELSDDQLYGESKDDVDQRYGVSPRFLMQRLGTEFVRNTIGETFWIDRFARWYESTEGDKIVISDIRFQNEIETIRSLGGYVLSVHRPSNGERDDHASEDAGSLQGVHGSVCNDSDFETLYGRVKRVLSQSQLTIAIDKQPGESSQF